MYGGDEVSAIVVDLGSHTCKAGYAGEDAPKAVFPSVIGAVDGGEAMDVDVDSTKTNSSEDSKTNNAEADKEKGKRKLYVGSQALSYRRDNMEILSPIKDGIVSDWDLVDNIWLSNPQRRDIMISHSQRGSRTRRWLPFLTIDDQFLAPPSVCIIIHAKKMLLFLNIDLGCFHMLV